MEVENQPGLKGILSVVRVEEPLTSRELDEHITLSPTEEYTTLWSVLKDIAGLHVMMRIMATRKRNKWRFETRVCHRKHSDLTGISMKVR